jgi:hypothetical protein
MKPNEVVRFLRLLNRDVLTFVGYSGMGYEDEQAMLAIARAELEGRDPAKTIINIGVTGDGIGVVYSLARSMGFVTSGIVSRVCLDYPAQLSPDVNLVFFVADRGWGGNLSGSNQLSPTSEAMVRASTSIVAIGGNEVSRDELSGARRLGIPINYYPAELNHQNADSRAKKRGEQPPESYSGAAHAHFGG